MNTLGHEIKFGEEVIIECSNGSKGEKEVKNRTFICEGGNGMRLDIPGGVIYGKWKCSGENGSIRVEHIDVEATKHLQGKQRMFDRRGNISRRLRRSNSNIR